MVYTVVYKSKRNQRRGMKYVHMCACHCQFVIVVQIQWMQKNKIQKKNVNLGKRSFTHHPLFSSFATPLIFYLENEREYSGICLLTKSTCGLPWPTAVSHCRILICSTHTFHEFHKSLPLIFYSNCQLQPLFCFPSTVVRNIEFYLKIMK